jgi:RNA polymerase sigma factor (sigma-70 family)
VRDERRLVRRAARGDRDAFTTIFRRFQQDLYRYCVGILGNSEDAQDALQNTMVKALGALPGERREIDLKPWLYRIAHNESIDLIRRRRQTVSLEDDGLPAGASLADEVETRHRLRQLLADVGELPERQRGALVMREAGGLEFEEIAAALGTTPGVARQTLYEARLGLREMDAGRNMDCVAVTKALSDGDRRSRRRRDISAHLKACSECRLFAEEIDSRKRALASISPLPALAAAALLQGLAGGGGGSGAAVGSGAAAASGTSAGAGVTGAVAGKAIGTATLLKGAATIAAVAAIGVGGADVGGFLHGHDGPSQAQAEPRDGSDPAAELQSQVTLAEPVGGVAPARTTPDTLSARRTVHDRIAFDKPRQDRPDHGKVPPGVPPARASVAAADRPGTSAAPVGPAPASPPVGDAAAPAPASGDSAVERPHGPDHAKQLPAAAAHGQETAAAAKEKEKGKSASAPGHSEKGDEAPDPAAEGHPTHPEHPAKPSHPEPSEPSPAPAAVPAETETPPPADPATGEDEPPAAEDAPPGERKGKT